MSKYEGKYFELGPGIIHIKDVHDQMARAVALIEIDDYAGNFYNNLYNHWFLNNDNIVFEMDYVLTNTLKEVTFQDFKNLLLKEISYSIHQIKTGNSYCMLYFKKTPERLKIVRKHYGAKP